MRRGSITGLSALALAAILAGCSGGGSGTSASGGDNGSGGGNVSSCTVVNVATSPEKVTLIQRIASDFQQSDASKSLGKCVTINVSPVSSGEGARLLQAGWPTDQTIVPKPDLWSPASSQWVDLVNSRSAKDVVTDSKSFVRTPLVFAMPRAMAQAMGWPTKPIGFSTLHDLAVNPQGWGAYNEPMWGPFRLGKTNPHYSTSGLNALLGLDYAHAHKTSHLTVGDVNAAKRYSAQFEASAVHYGSTTLAFLNNWFARDGHSEALSYASAVAVEEKSVIDYNRGNPDGVLSPGEHVRPPHDPLVAIYPKEGSLESDDPMAVLDEPWVSNASQAAAKAFRDFALQPDQQRLVLDYGFRPADPKAPLGGLVRTDMGVDPSQPKITLPKPPATVIAAATAQWDQIRKPSNVMLLFDVSGSMGDPVQAGSSVSKMQAATQGAISSLAHFRSNDNVGLRVFTDSFPNGVYSDVRPVTALGSGAEQLKQQIANLRPMQGTPLYRAILASYKQMEATAQPGRINAIVLMTDGMNDDNSSATLDQVLALVRTQSEHSSIAPVRIFAIAYGHDADENDLATIASASGGAVFDSRDAKRISLVFDDVMSNF